MDAKTSMKGRLPGRHLTAGGSTYAAPRAPAIARESGIASQAAEIPKKPRDVADSKPGGRYVAKDMIEIAEDTVSPADAVQLRPRCRGT